jgi:hypothetical protein
MTVPPSLLTQLAHDLARGQWSVPVRQFWVQALTAAGPLAPTAGLLRSLQRDWSQGRWQAVTATTTARLFPTATESQLATLRQEFQQGTLSPSTRRLIEEL